MLTAFELPVSKLRFRFFFLKVSKIYDSRDISILLQIDVELKTILKAEEKVRAVTKKRVLIISEVAFLYTKMRGFLEVIIISNLHLNICQKEF